MKPAKKMSSLVSTNGDSSPAIMGSHASVSYNSINKPNTKYRLFDPYWWRTLTIVLLAASVVFVSAIHYLVGDVRIIAALMFGWFLLAGFTYYWSWAEKAFDLYTYHKDSPIETDRGDSYEWSEIQEVRSYNRTVELLIGAAWVKLVFAKSSDQEGFLEKCGTRKIHISKFDQHPEREPLNWSNWWKPNLFIAAGIFLFAWLAKGGAIPVEWFRWVIIGTPLLWGAFLVYTILKLNGFAGAPVQTSKPQ
ncbi:MAG: hypothetical protein AB7E49_03420 [Campylobacterales bacterium]